MWKMKGGTICLLLMVFKPIFTMITTMYNDYVKEDDDEEDDDEEEDDDDDDDDVIIS